MRTRGSAAPGAAERRFEIAPQLRDYHKVDTVFWPYLTSVARPGVTAEAVSTDSRGHRVTRVGAEETRSDAAPDGAAFLVGASYAFGTGASNDSATLAAGLWRRTGVPYVNLGLRAATSTQELVGALPFVERASGFVVCSGLNNLACGGLSRLVAERSSGIDPLFGPMYDELRLGALTGLSIAALARLAGAAGGTVGDERLRKALRARRRKRVRRLTRPARRLAKRVRGRLASGAPAASEPGRPTASPGELDAVVADAAARQLRDLRLLRRATPAGTPVTFALQPVAWTTPKERSPEEFELFEILDRLQPLRWQRLEHLFETRWAAYARLLEDGCREAGVAFVDLAHAGYTGWCFVDRIHMTDRGYDTAAAALEEVLSAGDR